ncbi:MAG: hypothetical protein J2P36_29565, partial [Ktedonobacteraceae bacterium]|nr:hypothetical protein [Ktedonobacteraceae bacterium]
DKAYNILAQNKNRLIMISERLIKEETLEGPLFESLFNQPLSDEQFEGPSILAGMPSGEQQRSLPVPGITPQPQTPQIPPPYQEEASA